MKYRLLCLQFKAIFTIIVLPLDSYYIVFVVVLLVMQRLLFVRCEAFGDILIGDMVQYKPAVVTDPAPLASISVSRTVIATEVCRFHGLGFVSTTWTAAAPLPADFANAAIPFASPSAPLSFQPLR